MATLCFLSSCDLKMPHNPLCSYWGHGNGILLLVVVVVLVLLLLLYCIVALKGKTNSKKVQGET